MVRLALFMVLAVLLYLCLFSVQGARAAEFSASVNRSEVALGESFVLDLALTGAAPQGRPDFDGLRDDFTVHAQGQSSQTSIVNNKVSTSMHWQFVLIPKQVGEIVIPPIAINTDQGRLLSQPVRLKIRQAESGADGEDKYRSIFVRSEISETSPYENEPVFMTLRLISRRSLMNIEVPEITVDGAFVKRQGEPQIYDGVIDGSRVKVIEAQYLITSLKPGKLVIPPVTFKGRIQSDRPRGVHDPFSMLDSFGLPGLAYQPFAVSSAETVIEVRPPEVKMDPWLPLLSLEIFDVLEGANNATVGQPLTRKIAMGAVGGAGASLPDLEKQAAPEEGFRVYADKPQFGENISPDKTISGWREERYTLIPQESGQLVLPEIRVPWWDLKNGKIAYATVPSRIIMVRSAPAAAGMALPPAAQASAQMPPAEHKADGKSARYLYIVIAILAAAVLLLGLITLYLLYRVLRRRMRRRARRHFSRDRRRAPANQDEKGGVDLKTIKTAVELRRFIQSYAYASLQMPRQAPLDTIAAALKARGGDSSEISALFAALDRSLYARETADIAAMKTRFAALMKQQKKIRSLASKPAVLAAKLNPS